MPEVPLLTKSLTKHDDPAAYLTRDNTIRQWLGQMNFSPAVWIRLEPGNQWTADGVFSFVDKF